MKEHVTFVDPIEKAEPEEVVQVTDAEIGTVVVTNVTTLDDLLASLPSERLLGHEMLLPPAKWLKFSKKKKNQQKIKIECL